MRRSNSNAHHSSLISLEIYYSNSPTQPPPSFLKHPKHHTSPSVPLSTQHLLHTIPLCPVSPSLPLFLSASPSLPSLPSFPSSASCSPISTSLPTPTPTAEPKHSLMQIQQVLFRQPSQSAKESNSALSVGLR